MEYQEILNGYLSDMLGVEKHILEVINWQIDDKRIKEHEGAHGLLMRVRDTLARHTAALENRLSSLDIESSSADFKKGATTVTGMATGLYNLMRKDDAVMRNLRDDYTAMNMVAISYTMLHTTALANQDHETAGFALNHLKEVTPIVMEFAKIIPSVVVKELSMEEKAIDSSAVTQATENTQEAWRPESLS